MSGVEAQPIDLTEQLALRDGAGAARLAALLERRNAIDAPLRRRGWVVRRMLLLSDVLGLSLAFLVAGVVLRPSGASASHEAMVFLLSLPVWIVAAKLCGLYDRDEERTDHGSTNDLGGVFHLVTLGAWLLAAGAWVTGGGTVDIGRLTVFWGLALFLVVFSRTAARAVCRRDVVYLQNTLIVGADRTAQLIARKLIHHPEYRLNLVGFVDDMEHELRPEVAHIAMLGGPDRLPHLIKQYDVERVIFAFPDAPIADNIELVRSLKDLDVQVDIVPRLYEVVGPNVTVHTVETLPLVGLPPVRIGRSSRLVKRTIDVFGALVALVLTAPLFAFVAWRIKRDSPGPVFFRQTRLGINMREFTVLKFRTMQDGTSDAAHREFVRATSDHLARTAENGLYKLDQRDAVTKVGRWLRRTSLDELPQLLNVLRGDMALVGPRPCIAYETENFAPYHFERFLVPAGITGFWQVSARAHASFGEALDMDVAYARGWSLGLDLRLLMRTPMKVLRPSETR